MIKQHWAIFVTNQSNTRQLIQNLLTHTLPEFSFLNNTKGVLFSKLAIEKLIDEEERHGKNLLAHNTNQTLKTMSSGEQKKALLEHLLSEEPEFIVLDNPFDNLDTHSQKRLIKTLTDRADKTIFIQIVSRKADVLPFIKHFASLDEKELSIHENGKKPLEELERNPFQGKIPKAIAPIKSLQEELITLKDVTIRFGEKTVLQNINWSIKKGEFWQLIGKNGSGKTTILSMITGENPKGYGQELFLFGSKKGSGESIWDIKQKIGYFTPSMTDKFSGYHTIENMLISGFNDSIGLYIKPTEAQLRLAKEWLELINLWDMKDTLFRQLSMGQKRLIMTTRAMIKHPLLLILDEPTAGLDDASAKLLVTLVNKIAAESSTATIFVSHRKEPNLKPNFVYELQMSEFGSTGNIISNY